MGLSDPMARGYEEQETFEGNDRIYSFLNRHPLDTLFDALGPNRNGQRANKRSDAGRTFISRIRIAGRVVERHDTYEYGGEADEPWATEYRVNDEEYLDVIDAWRALITST